MELNAHLAEKLLRQLSAVTTHQLGIIRTDGIIAAHTSDILRNQFSRPAKEVADKALPELLIPESAQSEDTLSGLYLPVSLNRRTACILLIHSGTEEDLLSYGRLLQQICRLNLEQLISGNYFNLRHYERTTFCLDWLEGKFEDDLALFSERALLNQIDTVAGVTCAVLRIPQVAMNQALKFSVAEILHQLDLLAIPREADFILILNMRAPQKVSQRLEQVCSAISPLVTRYLIAVGRPYSCDRIRSSYQEAYKLANYYMSTVNGIIYYQNELLNLYLYDAPDTMKKQFILQTFPGYSRPELKQVYEFIQTYLECNGSIQAISQRLFVHKNTIQYRIEQLRKRTGYDLRNLADCQTLAIACKWMRF